MILNTKIWCDEVTFSFSKELLSQEIFVAGNEDIILYLRSDKKPDYPVMRPATSQLVQSGRGNP